MLLFMLIKVVLSFQSLDEFVEFPELNACGGPLVQKLTNRIFNWIFGRKI